MTSENKTAFQIFMTGFGIYIKYFSTFFKYMSFPVLGQFFGIILCFALSLGYTYSGSKPNFSTAMLLTIPGLIIFTKAFWEYLVAYVSISSMTENTIKSGRIYDIDAHKKVATKRGSEFVFLWLLFGLFTIIAIFPPMWVFAAIIFVYIVLIFQVFAFEKKLTPFECFVRSKDLIRGNFWHTVILLVFVGIFTYILLPKITETLCSVFKIIPIFAMYLEPAINNILPFEEWNATAQSLGISFSLTPMYIGKMLVSSVITSLVIGYTLPLRSICWTLWYKQLSIKEIKEKSKNKKAKSKENV
ncbi:MAG: hypothetical protein ACI37S_08540 [Candidatus Gastranaerophilaceae bacterium]